MSNLIVKCRYLKQSKGRHSKNLIKYIATRDGVEKSDDSWKHASATNEQKKLIGEILNDFPDLRDDTEYKLYEKSMTKGAASKLISYAIDSNIDLIGKRENYVGYIAKRPHIEKTGTHGLFTDDNIEVNLSAVAKEVAEHEGNVWTDVISLQRDDAVRLGYDNAKAWKNLLRGHTDTLAESMKIPLQDLRWYAAFHNEGHHPHVHVVAYSVGKEPYLTKQGIFKLKSDLAHEIFKQDLVQIYSEQTQKRDELKKSSEEMVSEIIEQINNGEYKNETVELMLKKLAEQLENYSGKKVYGYLPKTAKNLINGIVDELQKDKRIQKLYDLWYEQRENVLKTYRDEMPERIALSDNKEFKSIKNMIIKEADGLLNPGHSKLYELEEAASNEEILCCDEQNQTNSGDEVESMEERNKKIRTTQKQRSEQTSVELVALKLFEGLARMICNNLEHDDAEQVFSDRKLMQKTAQKKLAQGQKLG